MPTILDLDFTGTVEPKAYPGGKEYKIRLLDVTKDTNKNDEAYILPRFEISGKPDSKDFTHYMGLPHSGMNEKQANSAKFRIMQFYGCFGIPTKGKINLEDYKGKEGWAILGYKEDDEYGPQNFVRKFLEKKG